MAIPKLHSYSLDNILDGVTNKVNWNLDANRAVLLIHDMQQYFLDFYADDALKTHLIKTVSEIKAACKAQGIPVVYTAQPGDQTPQDRALLTDFWGTGLKENQEITRIVPEVAPDADDTVLTKWRYSAFKRSPLLESMQEQQRDQLIIVGVYAHIGCMLTAADAFMYDVQAFFVADGLGDFSREEHVEALQYVAKRCGYVTSQAEIMQSLQGQSNVVTLPTSKAHLKTLVAQLIEVEEDEIYDDDNLLDLGLDSVRAMTLLGHWQKAGLNTSFVEFASMPSVDRWWQLIEPQLAA
ncbi:isochorismatase family protein [Vibrio viridaestus]|uniref:isochorismatase n=1 Tax=Vibrio viridaestus TaxID=2487322 RepID=A0A3N9U157_9VIBR|nr:isochorismatase family protein [Vibrio viridaestus]RQW61486.1 isochorismatase family protein [Vibrio viridaestus]